MLRASILQGSRIALVGALFAAPRARARCETRARGTLRAKEMSARSEKGCGVVEKLMTDTAEEVPWVVFIGHGRNGEEGAEEEQKYEVRGLRVDDRGPRSSS